MNKYNIGDMVVCLPGFIGSDHHNNSDPNYAGYGYIDGAILTITRITQNNSDRISLQPKGPVYWFHNHEGGVYESFLLPYEEYVKISKQPWIGSKLLFKFV